MKQAFLIMAHNNLPMLQALISSLDHKKVDIYIHIDLKFKDFKEEVLLDKIQFSNIYFVDKQKVFWGGYSQIQVELSLFRAAYFSSQNYTYYHLMSGQDVLLQPIDSILEYFSNQYPSQFIEYDRVDESTLKRIKFYYPFQDRINKRSISSRVAKVGVEVQKILRVDRIKKNELAFYKGSNWVSITRDAVGSILKETKPIIEKSFKNGFLVDEMYKQTIIGQTKHKYDIKNNNLRYIDWERGNPYTFKVSDLPELISSNKLFARKVTDPSIIKQIRQNFQEGKND